MKPRVSIVTVGHVDHGKSTLLGRLLVAKGVVSHEEIARYERQADLLGKASFKYAWALDKSDESRARGLTLDLNYADFATRNRKVHLIDAPGHQDFVRSMISGTTGADAALLVIDVAEGVMPQTREHAQLANAMGLRQVIVALNKIDRVGYDAKKISQAAAAVRDFLGAFGFDRIDVIPVSAWEGENLTTRTAVMSWYKGRTLEEAIDSLDVRAPAGEGALRLPAMGILSVDGVGTVLIGRIERGTLRDGMEVAIEPAGKIATVKSIEIHGQSVGDATAGDTVGVALRGVGRNDIARGDVLGPVDEPPVEVDAFTARVAITGDVGNAGVGWSPMIHCHAACVPVRLAEVLARIDPTSGEEEPVTRPYLTKGDVARVSFVPLKPLVIEGAAAGPALGRFALRLGRLTVGAGSCIGVTPHEKDVAAGPKNAGFSFKHEKTGTAARRKKEKEVAEARDIHGRPIERGKK
ncbi:MAG: GTP-binding protein [Candidatus Thermoplasmatota archaeon]